MPLYGFSLWPSSRTWLIIEFRVGRNFLSSEFWHQCSLFSFCPSILPSSFPPSLSSHVAQASLELTSAKDDLDLLCLPPGAGISRGTPSVYAMLGMGSMHAKGTLTQLSYIPSPLSHSYYWSRWETSKSFTLRVVLGDLRSQAMFPLVHSVLTRPLNCFTGPLCPFPADSSNSRDPLIFFPVSFFHFLACSLFLPSNLPARLFLKNFHVPVFPSIYVGLCYRDLLTFHGCFACPLKKLCFTLSFSHIIFLKSGYCYCVYAWECRCLQRLEARGFRLPWGWSYGQLWATQHEYQELNSGSLQEFDALLSTKPSLQFLPLLSLFSLSFFLSFCRSFWCISKILNILNIW